MKKIGSFLKEERIKKKLSLKDMERETKIKREFIDDIEQGDWGRLPEYPVILGFIKTLAKNLGIPEEKAIAIFRRDFPKEKSNISVYPKPDLKLKITVNPKIITLILSGIFVLSFIGYLVYQYMQYISPPKLDVSIPSENQEVGVGEVEVLGKTDPDATLTVNNQSILVSETGEFFDRVQVGENSKVLTFVAKSRYGKETVVVRNIIPKPK